ncbi:hypothetical protein EJ02DRAFT_455846 [Clathrospora elynae]|uniref:Uncharacterized protein n=1 Tax=Clathrospora elynae TaxID=706981 RepID=A0A6A5SQ05_9PLEO|nr:hypothetical protein EJ02DRAFT_455846 [Clathrospora elynae]
MPASNEQAQCLTQARASSQEASAAPEGVHVQRSTREQQPSEKEQRKKARVPELLQWKDAELADGLCKLIVANKGGTKGKMVDAGLSNGGGDIAMVD